MLHLFHGKFLLSHSLCQGFVVMLFLHAPPTQSKDTLKVWTFFVAVICGMLLRKHSSHVFSGGSIFSSVFTTAYLELCALLCLPFCLVLCTSLADSVRGTRSTPCATPNDFGAVVTTFHAPLPYLPTSWQELSCCCLTLELYEFFCCCAVVCVVWQWNVCGYWRYALSLVCWLSSASSSSSSS